MEAYPDNIFCPDLPWVTTMLK